MDHHHHHQQHPHLHHPQNPPTTTNTTTTNSNRAEAERLLSIAEKLLQTRDLTGSREFAMLAQETEPLLEGSDQILAITDVLIASEKPINHNNINNTRNNHHDWYAILQIDPPRNSHPNNINNNLDLIKKNYRRLALLLHPDKNKYPLADTAFKLVADAWATLSNPVTRSRYDREFNVFAKVDLRYQPQQQTQQPQQQQQQQPQQQQQQQQQQEKGDKLPVRRSPRGGGEMNNNMRGAERVAGRRENRNNNNIRERERDSFWTACPYCYVLYEFQRAYEECCIRCQNCERAFHAAAIPSLPPMVPGKEAYYCCWGFFPLGFSMSKAKEVGNGGDGNVGNDHYNDVNINVNNDISRENNENNNNVNNPNSGFPNWMPGMFGAVPQQGQGVMGGGNVNINVPNVNVNAPVGGGGGGVDMSDGSGSAGFGNNYNNSNVSGGFRSTPPGMPVSGAKKRGRPRKNPL